MDTKPMSNAAKDLLQKLDDIYKTNVGIVPAINETTAAVKRGYLEYAT